MIPGIGVPIILVRASALYPFTSFTFTNCSITGQNGPTLANMQSAYSATSWTQNTSYLNIGAFQGYQKWTVPKTGTYRFDIAGAGGGIPSYAPSYQGLGVRAQADIALTSGEFIIIAVGQLGGAGTYSSGGGGGTFIVRNTGSAALLIAGGAGGAYAFSDYRANSNASVTTSGNTPAGGYTTNGASGGGGFSSAGQTGYGGSTGGGGFNNGLIGGGACSAPTTGLGSFGGGGGEWCYYGSGGGGGGYSGGGGGTGGAGGSAGAYAVGGGGSYNIGTATNVTFTSTYNTSDGYATITFLA